MRAFSRGTLLLLLSALFTAPSSSAQASSEPRPPADFPLAGRLPWGASALPTGEILAPAEDQTLTVIDGSVLARWTAGSRFSAPLTVAPAPYSLVAAPQSSGRADVLEWDARTRVLAPRFAATRPIAATASAWAASGAVSFAWRDGEVETWTSQGTLLWRASAGFEVRFLLVDESLGVYAFGAGQAVLLDAHGRPAANWIFGGTPRGVAQSTAGELYCWTETGLWKKGYDAAAFTLIDGANLLGLAIDRQDKLVTAQSDRLRRLSSNGTLLSEIKLLRPALTAPTLDERGRIVVGTAAGLEVWTYDGRLLAVLGDSSVSSAAVIANGNAAWGSDDWRAHVAPGFQLPAYGWPQEGGRGRAFAARRPESVAVRRAAWNDNVEFSYLFQLAASGEEDKQRQVLERFEAQAAKGSLLAAWPYANLILLKIARSGLTDLRLERSRVVNNWPALRSRAYALLAATAGTEDREELLDLLRHEYDPPAAAQGVRALAQSGWDGDGKLMRLLAELQGRLPDPTVADAVLETARSLWLTNGQSADPALIPLVSALFQGPYPRILKQKAQKFFQDLVTSD